MTHVSDAFRLELTPLRSLTQFMRLLILVTQCSEVTHSSEVPHTVYEVIHLVAQCSELTQVTHPRNLVHTFN